MRRILVFPAFLGLILIIGCAANYQALQPEKILQSPAKFEGKKITVTGIPDKPQRKDFQRPTPFTKGYWYVKINDLLCYQEVNYENESRISACRNLANRAHKNKQKVTVSGELKQGILRIESFQGIKTNTPWYRCEGPYHYYYRPYWWPGPVYHYWYYWDYPVPVYRYRYYWRPWRYYYWDWNCDPFWLDP